MRACGLFLIKRCRQYWNIFGLQCGCKHVMACQGAEEAPFSKKCLEALGSEQCYRQCQDIAATSLTIIHNPHLQD